ncbi:hypothetical protein ACHAPJ_007329 [Fusarium lateritium]
MPSLLHSVTAAVGLVLLAPQLALSATLQSRAPAAWSNFNNNIVFTPPSNWAPPRTIYARTLQLPDKSLLITSEIYDNENKNLSLPIFRSQDGGATWKEYSRLYDRVNGWGMRYQPFLFTLPVKLGSYAAGTILAVGTSIPQDLSKAYIDLYASTDAGRNFKFVSHIAYGPGLEYVENGALAIWEAFLMMYQGKLVVYYSDQRDWPAHGQKLVHATTTNLRDWSPVVNDVAMPDSGQRPGMPIVAYSPKSGKYVLTFEYCGGPVNCQAYYKVSNDPLSFDGKDSGPIYDKDNHDQIPIGSPYVIWAAKPGATDGSGIFIANGNSDGAVYVNDDDANPDNWKRIDIGQKNAYSRSLRIITTPSGKRKLLVGGAGNFGEENTNAITVGVVDIPF